MKLRHKKESEVSFLESPLRLPVLRHCLYYKDKKRRNTGGSDVRPRTIVL